jgi:hypothetical protein
VGKFWQCIIADDLDNRVKDYVECIGETRNQLLEFRVSEAEGQYARIIMRGKGDNLTFNRLLRRDWAVSQPESNCCSNFAPLRPH